MEIESIYGEVLFTSEAEKIVPALKEAISQGANLRGAYLSGADLSGADLSGADLSGADLSGADLRNVDLSGADLRNAKNIESAKLPIYAKWDVAIRGDVLHIGCKTKTFEEWEIWFNGSEEFSTARGTKDFKRLHAVFLAYKAYYEFMKS